MNKVRAAAGLLLAAVVLFGLSKALRRPAVEHEQEHAECTRLETAESLQLDGKYGDARRVFEQALEQDELDKADEERCLWGLAQCLVQDGKANLALRVCVRLQALSPHKAHVIRAAAYEILGRPLDAKRERENAAKLGDSIAGAG